MGDPSIASQQLRPPGQPGSAGPPGELHTAAPERADFMERLGIRALRKREAQAGQQGGPAAPASTRAAVLTAEQQQAIKRVKTRTILRAAGAGLFFGLVAGGGEMFATAVLGLTTERIYESVGTALSFWAILGPIVIAATLGEIFFLYWDTLRSVHELSRIAGIELFAPGVNDRASVAAALARAALELPNPKAPHRYGIDPLREASKVRLVIAAILYKAKRGATNILLKIVVKRFGTRAGARGAATASPLLPLLAAPVFGVWNAYTLWVVMREARIRVIGPSAARQLAEGAFLGRAELSAEAKVAVLRAIGATCARKWDLHPNVMALLDEVVARVGPPATDARLDDSAAFLAGLAALSHDERTRVLEVLAAALIIDGRLTRREERLYLTAQEAAGLTPDIAPLRVLVRAMRDGNLGNSAAIPVTVPA